MKINKWFLLELISCMLTTYCLLNQFYELTLIGTFATFTFFGMYWGEFLERRRVYKSNGD